MPLHRARSAIVSASSIAKNRQTTLCAISDAAEAELRTLIHPNSPPFACPFSGVVPRGPRFRKDLAAAGISSVDEQERRRDMHSMRKTFGTALVLAGEQPRIVMEAMRHSDLQLTMKTYTDAARLRGPVIEAVARLPWRRENTA